MHRWRNASFLLILAIGTSIAETVQNVQKYTTLPQEEVQVSEIPVDTGKLDYESALRPAVLQKRSIANIARLLLGGGSAPPNHPLVKYPEQKTWNMASNIVAAFPGGSGLQTAASNTAEGWTRQPSSALQNIQQLFETKAKIIPYTGQVATGLTGLASVKGDLIRQIHSISTQAIAQAAAEAAARALASAAAAHAVTNSIAHSVNHGAQTGIKGGWSSYQNAYVEPSGKTPGDQPGPPYQESAHINHYQAPPSNYNPYAAPATTPAPPTYPPAPATYPPQPQPHMQPYQNGYYTLYNTQQPNSQTPYTPAPPVAHARPTLSPSTLIATTPSVPAGNFGRNAAQPSSTSSLLSTISSLLSASSAAYNAAFTGPNQQPSGFAGANQQRQSAYAGRGSNQQQQSATFFPTLLPSANSPLAASPPVLRPTSPATAASSILSSGINSAAAHNNGYQQQSINAISQGSGYYGGIPSGGGTNYLQHQSGSAYSSAPETRSASVNAPGYSFNQHGSGHIGANYAQSGANPYASQSVQPSPQFGSGPAGPQSAAGGIGNSRFSTNGLGYNQGPVGSRYPGNNGGAGSGPGHVGGWNNVNAGPSASASTWPGSPNNYPPGYSGQATGNINNSPGSFRGSSTAQFPVAAGSSFAQQTYPTAASNAYQPPTVNNYAQAQSASYSQQPSQFNYYPNGYQSASGNANSLGGFRNPDITQRYDSHDQRQSASTMGNDFNDDDPNDDIDNDDDTRHHNYQPAQRRNRPQPNNSYSNSRYPNPAKKRPLKRPPPPRTHSQSKNNHYNRNNVNTSHNSKPKHGNSVRKDVGEKGKRVISTGPKKGGQIKIPLGDSGPIRFTISIPMVDGTGKRLSPSKLLQRMSVGMAEDQKGLVLNLDNQRGVPTKITEIRRYPQAMDVIRRKSTKTNIWESPKLKQPNYTEESIELISRRSNNHKSQQITSQETSIQHSQNTFSEWENGQTSSFDQGESGSREYLSGEEEHPFTQGLEKRMGMAAAAAVVLPKKSSQSRLQIMPSTMKLSPGKVLLKRIWRNPQMPLGRSLTKTQEEAKRKSLSALVKRLMKPQELTS